MEEIMAENVREELAENIEENLTKKEFSEINAILPSLWMKGFITDIECRIIASSSPLEDKQGAVYRVIMSKPKEEAANLAEIFRTLYVGVHLKEDSPKLSVTNSECKTHDNDTTTDSPLKMKKNPFLNNTVIKCLFGFLPLDDLKNARFVCRQWNSTAEICLRKRSAIQFRPNDLLPETFIEISKYSLPDLPFPSFKFSVDDSAWSIFEIQTFFDLWGKNTKEVIFDKLVLENPTDPELCIANYDTTPWFANASSLSSLKIKCALQQDEDLNVITGTALDISIDKLISIKTVFLENICILTSAKNEYTRAAPVNVSLFNVGVKQDGKILQTFCVNDFVDFSSAVNISINNRDFDTERPIIFDMSSQVFNADYLHLIWVKVENWAHAKGEVKYLDISGSRYIEKNQLKFNQLYCFETELDLSVLPQTIEKIQIARCTHIFCSEPIELPNLKFVDLQFDLDDNFTSLLTHFRNCVNLVELELTADADQQWTFHLNCVPRSVRKLRLNGFQFRFVQNYDYILELDTLILEDHYGSSGFADCLNVLRKIKPTILVLVYFQNMALDTSDIMKLVYTQRQIEKILVGSHFDGVDLHEKNPFKGSTLSYCVDKKSDYYQFHNQVGKAITRQEFMSWRKMNNMDEWSREFFRH